MTKRTCLRAAGLAGSFALVVGGFSGAAFGADNCDFLDTGDTLVLQGDCTTDTTIVIPGGYTLNGHGYAITAVNPPSGGFLGAVVANGGASAYVTNVVIQAEGLTACQGGDNRLRGILLEGASGAVTHSTVRGINRGPSGCQEGNAIEVRNAPFDGTHPNTVSVDILQNTVEDYQKGGIICNGDAVCSIERNAVGASMAQENLAANSVQIGFGATGSIRLNNIDGNQWMGTSDYAATAILVYGGSGVVVQRNNIGGNSDIGIYFLSDDGAVNNNRIFDTGSDHPNSGYDIGLGNYGSGNAITRNKIRGFDTPTDGVDGGQVIIPSPGD